MHYFYYGNDLRLLQKELDLLVKKILNDYPNYKVLGSVIESSGALDSFLQENSLFGDLFVAKVKLSKDIDLKESLLNESDHIFIFYNDEDKNILPKGIEKKVQMTVQNYSLPKPWNLEKLIISQMKSRVAKEMVPYLASFMQSTLEIEDILLLMDQNGLDILTLSNYKTVIPHAEIKSFIVVDTFFQNKPHLFFNQLNDYLSSGESPDPLLFGILKKASHFIDLKKLVKQNLPLDKIAQTMGISSFIIKQQKETIRAFSLTGLENIVINALKTQFLIRQSAGVANAYYLEKLYLDHHKN